MCCYLSFTINCFIYTPFKCSQLPENFEKVEENLPLCFRMSRIIQKFLGILLLKHLFSVALYLKTNIQKIEIVANKKISVSFFCYEDSLSAYECLYFLKILPVASRLCIQTYFYESFSFLYAFFSSRCCSTRLVWAIFMRMSSFNAGVH